MRAIRIGNPFAVAVEFKRVAVGVLLNVVHDLPLKKEEAVQSLGPSPLHCLRKADPSLAVRCFSPRTMSVAAIGDAFILCFLDNR